MATPDLKPCPFCGSDQIQFRAEGYFKPWEGKGLEFWYYCECYECNARTDPGCAKTMEQAAEEWNRRN